MNFSMNTRSSPKDDFASERARANAFRDLGLEPRDPQPFAAAARDAFIMTG